MKKKIKKLLKNKKVVIFLILFLILLVCIFILRGVFFPGVGSNYGNRLEGIKNIQFTNKTQDKIVKSIKDNEKVTEAKIIIHGKIINVIFNVSKDTSRDDAKAIANASLEKFSDKVKGFYDIQFLITKTDEEGEEVEVPNSDGTNTKEIRKQFPIMGYKNSNRNDIVW